MQTIIRSGTVYRNQGATEATSAHASRGRQGVEGERGQHPSMGAGCKQTRPAKAGAHPANHRRTFGGQRAVSLFGCPGCFYRPGNIVQTLVGTQIPAQGQAQPTRPQPPVDPLTDQEEAADYERWLVEIVEEEHEARQAELDAHLTTLHGGVGMVELQLARD